MRFAGDAHAACRRACDGLTPDKLPKEQQPTQLLPLTKIFTDTLKMIAYRAETAMVAMLKRHLNKEEEARALVRELLISAGDSELAR